MTEVVHTALAAARATAVPLTGADSDYDALLELVGDRSFVLLGESTHGTREFYRLRADISRCLIEELGFDAVAVEGDWPDAWRVDRFVRGDGDASADDALSGFERFPRWMWRNAQARDFIDWLHAHNARLPRERRAGFYGIDLYSLYQSADDVVRYVEEAEPDFAPAARRMYECLDGVRDPQEYAFEAIQGLRPDCREHLVGMLSLLQRWDDGHAPDDRFHAARSAELVLNAEAYYRAMFSTRVNTWNLRDSHMTDTLLALRAHLRAQGRRGRVVVWAHNSHLGDARATEMGWRGEHNVGQLVRERVGDDALLVGFTTFTGCVAAAHDWGGAVERQVLRPAREDSCEHLFHRTGLDRFFLPLHTAASRPLADVLLERAVGVVYRPETERASHYFEASPALQFDALFHLDETDAVEPLDA